MSKPYLWAGAEPSLTYPGRWDAVVFGIYSSESGEFVYKRIESFATEVEAETAAREWMASNVTTDQKVT